MKFKIPLTAFLLTVLLQWGTGVCAQDTMQTVTLSRKNASLQSLLKEINEQTGIGYLYESRWLARSVKVTIKVKNEPIISVLDKCFAEQPFSYVFSGHSITFVERTISDRNIDSSIIVTGTITNQRKGPLPGAYVMIKDMLVGTTTDSAGHFEIVVPGLQSLLEISFVGYNPQTIRIDNKQPLLIVLAEKPTYLEEVITQGYTTTQRKMSLATITKIKYEEINRQPVNNPLGTLQGRVPGLLVTQKSGLPGSGYSFLARGQRSIGISADNLPSNSPLFIIDGIPFLNSSEVMTQRTGIISAFSPFSTINPADIESIEVLKDANATSIYGSLGANGVILITTRKPNAGKPSIDINMYTGFGKITRSLDFMTTKEYVEMRREALMNDGETATPLNSPDLFWDTTRYINWPEKLIGGTAHVSNAHIRMSGGSATTQVSGSIGYNKESTVFPGDFYKSLLSASLQVIHQQSKKLDIVYSTSYGFDKNYFPSRDLTQYISSLPNMAPPYGPNGALVFREDEVSTGNPMQFVHQPVQVSMERITGSVKLNYKFFPWLHAKANLGYNSLTTTEHIRIPMTSQDPDLLPTPSRLAVFAGSKMKSLIAEPQLEFIQNTFTKGKIKALIGTSFRDQTGTSNTVTGSGYTNDENMGSIAAAASILASNEKRQYRLHSIYGLLNYVWDNKYLTEVTARRDGSSRFGPDRQFANFASFAAGWIFSNEKFFQDAFPIISFGKLRISYGTTGNDQIGDYQFLDTWISTQYPYPNQTSPGVRPVRLYNNDYQWELQKSTDIGLDIGLLNDKVFISSVWNQGHTSNQLISYSLPGQAGFGGVLRNFPAVVQNRNIEFQVKTILADKQNFKWNTNFNISLQRNKLIKFPGLESTAYGRIFRIGQPLNLKLGYLSDGVDPATGVYKILYPDGTPIDIPNTLPTEKDRVIIGSFDPKFFGGFENSMQYKNWRFDLHFYFVKQQGFNQITSQSIPAGFLPYNQPRDVLNNWQKPGENASYQLYTQNSSSPAYYAAFYYSQSSAIISDASFIRLKNLSVSYNLRYEWIRKLKMSSCNLYVHAQNLLTLTSYKGNDPENGTINQAGLPPLKMVTFGIQASL